ncbi:MAG: AMP-binding protein, partial [Luminiphilus sp.]
AAALATVESINNQIEKHARIGAVIFSTKPWTIENEILTPTMKIRREQIEKQFGEDAERLAREGAEAGNILMRWAD